jgi:hypothetical protein
MVVHKQIFVYVFSVCTKALTRLCAARSSRLRLNADISGWRRSALGCALSRVTQVCCGDGGILIILLLLGLSVVIAQCLGCRRAQAAAARHPRDRAANACMGGEDDRP